MEDSVDVRTSIAISKGAVSTVSLEALMSAEGAPLDLSKGNDHLVMVLPVLTCSHRATRTVKTRPPENERGLRPLYDTAEHFITTAGLFLHTKVGNYPALTATLPVDPVQAPQYRLTYGQIIGLAGDFYGDPDLPVCKVEGGREKQIEKFFLNFQSLQKSQNEVDRLLKITNQYEFEPIKKRVHDHQPPSGAYASIKKEKDPHMNDEDYEFDQVTGPTQWVPLKFSRYLGLASTNLDHFGQDAITCYLAGHVKAQRVAMDVHKQPAEQQTEAMLHAYAINAFADHFLTDLFAAGHMRTPRRALFESAWGNAISQGLAGICAKAMHDEDNKNGLWVKNKNGDTWVAFGDARYRDRVNSANRRMMKAALQRSMDDVWDAFNGHPVENSQVLDLLPALIWENGSEAAWKDPRNWAPLFWWNQAKNVNYRRSDTDNMADRSYKEQAFFHPSPDYWWLETTGALLKDHKAFMPKSEFDRWGYRYPPEEGASGGEIGWPPYNPSVTGPVRMEHGFTGPDLASVDWGIDGTSGPAGG